MCYIHKCVRGNEVCVCVCLYDWPGYSGHYKNRFYNFKSGNSKFCLLNIRRGQKMKYVA